MKKVAIFGSGNGSNFQAIIEYYKGNGVFFVCISDKKNAYILKRAKKLGIESYYVPFERTENFLKENKFDLHVLAGYMRVLPPEVLKIGRFINIHPSLLPKYKGLNAIKRAYYSGEKETGVTIHYVTSDLDGGEIIAQEKLFIKDNMTLQQLEEGIHKLEHKLYPSVIEGML